MDIHTDCRHFRGDRPCQPHKQHAVHCSDCIYYKRINFHVLIIKLDAMGDVLRTTCILGPIHERYPNARISWLTMDNTKALFFENKLVDDVIGFSGDAWLEIQSVHYDLVFNLDSSPASSKLASIVNADKKIGFGYDSKGYVYPFNDEAREWFEMGLFDDIKIKNNKTYQSIALEICGLTGDDSLHLYLSENEKKWANSKVKELGIKSSQPVIGLNTGASARWPHKKWTEEGFISIINMLSEDKSNFSEEPAIILFGGQEEVERNTRIVKAVGNNVIDLGTDLSLRQFFSMINECELIVTGDTLGLHVAAALDKKIVAIFGPTSAPEIELYGRGIKHVSDAPCIGMYKTICDVTPTCMERITPEQIYASIVKLME